MNIALGGICFIDPEGYFRVFIHDAHHDKMLARTTDASITILDRPQTPEERSVLPTFPLAVLNQDKSSAHTVLIPKVSE